MINYVVKCIMDDDGIKMCVGKKGFENEPREDEIRAVLAEYPEAGFAVVVKKQVSKMMQAGG
ncbi:MAG: hypothetical protein SPL99_05245 [Catonella sp.]|nr:hypothetical protein [Catonella sp.]MDY6355782.1 hypothetical protein [Catonella sp.]